MIDVKLLDNDSLIECCATNVMKSYQDANKWLDIIKESILMDMGCVFFSNYIHNLAHTMPERFDKFGDILHTENMKVPYPATEYIDYEPCCIVEVFTKVFEILTNIKCSLSRFIESADKEGYNAMKISAESLLEDISKENTNLKRMQTAYNKISNDIEFDKWVEQYVNNLDSLID